MEATPKVSMNPRHHYVGQGGAYDRLLDNGPLTDRKINAYKKRGYFTGLVNDPRLRAKDEIKAKRAAKKKPGISVDKLLEAYA